MKSDVKLLIIVIWGALVSYGIYHAIDVSKSVPMTTLYASARSLMFVFLSRYAIIKTDNFIGKIHIYGILAYVLYLFGNRTYCAICEWSDYAEFRKLMNDYEASLKILILIASILMATTITSLIWKKKKRL